MSKNETYYLPDRDIKTVDKIAVIYNLSGCHWGLLYVSLWTKYEPSVFIYDPLMNGDWQQVLYDVWKDFVRPLIANWYARDDPKENVDVEFPLGSIPEQGGRRKVPIPKGSEQNIAQLEPARGRMEFLQHPTQEDGYTCGFYVFGVLEAYLSEQTKIIDEENKLPKKGLDIIRMRMLHMILHKGDRSHTADSDTIAAKRVEIEQVLADYMKSVGQVKDLKNALSSASRAIKEGPIPSATTTDTANQVASATGTSDSATTNLPESDKKESVSDQKASIRSSGRVRTPSRKRAVDPSTAPVKRAPSKKKVKIQTKVDDADLVNVKKEEDADVAMSKKEDSTPAQVSSENDPGNVLI